jgi:predicted DCC family thiol-disulfide oxidoreductase YuxK
MGREVMTNPHLVFYDGECGFCDHIVQILLTLDRNEIFSFAPLQGETAARLLKELPLDAKKEDSLVLVENFRDPSRKYFILGKAGLRILWLLGGAWTLVGWISFLPAFLYDWVYRLVARNRHRWLSTTECPLPTPETRHRFLP